MKAYKLIAKIFIYLSISLVSLFSIHTLANDSKYVSGEFIVMTDMIRIDTKIIKDWTKNPNISLRSLGNNYYLITDTRVEKTKLPSEKDKLHTNLENSLKKISKFKSISKNNIIENAGQKFNDDLFYHGFNWNAKNIRTEEGYRELWNYKPIRTVIVGVVDSGLNKNHEDLSGQLWVNKGEIPGNGKDDEGNGYIDDVNGYNFVNRTADFEDDVAPSGHGTGVSSLIAAKADNKKGIVGVCQECRIMTIKVIDHKNLIKEADVIEGINYAVNNGVEILNHSWGGSYCSSNLEDSIKYAENSKIFQIVASGNSKKNMDKYSFCPASLPGVIVVGGTAHVINDSYPYNYNKPYYYSNYGSIVVLSAPATSVLGASTSFEPIGGKYTTLTGTSFAAPQVTGAVGVILSYSNNRYFEIESIKSILRKSVTPFETFDESSIFTNKLGTGVLNLEKVANNIPNPRIKTDCEKMAEQRVRGGYYKDLYCAPTETF